MTNTASAVRDLNPRPTGGLRWWLPKKNEAGYPLPVLQQEWLNPWSGQTEWRDVPTEVERDASAIP